MASVLVEGSGSGFQLRRNERESPQVPPGEIQVGYQEKKYHGKGFQNHGEVGFRDTG